MNKKIKLIWDFRGPDSLKIAEHHLIHLNDYILSSNLKESDAGFETKNSSYTLAYMTVNQEQMPAIRDSLKPHRGEFID